MFRPSYLDDAIASQSKPRFRSKFDERLCPAVAMRYSICTAPRGIFRQTKKTARAVFFICRVVDLFGPFISLAKRDAIIKVDTER